METKSKENIKKPKTTTEDTEQLQMEKESKENIKTTAQIMEQL